MNFFAISCFDLSASSELYDTLKKLIDFVKLAHGPC